MIQSPMEIMFLCGLAVVAACLAPYVIAQFRRKPERKDPYGDLAATINAAGSEPTTTDKLDKMRDKFREEGNWHGRYPATARKFGKREHVPASKSFFINRRQLEQINMKRRTSMRTPLSRAGFQAAVAHASTLSNQPQTSSDWITYLILWECFNDQLMQHTVNATSGISITPDAPFNGHDGTFGGAGASGNWADPATPAAQSAAMISQLSAPDVSPPASSPSSSYQSLGGDSAPTPSAPSYTPDPAPTPSYTPDPAPSYTPSADTFSSVSVDTASAASNVDSGAAGL